METYRTSVPALDPVASGLLESHAPAIELGQSINVNNVIASKRQLEWREAINSTHPQLVTNDELVAAVRRHRIVKSLHLDVAPDEEHIPRWAQEMRTEAQEMRTEAQEMRTEEQERHTELRTEMRSISQLTQRALNRGVKKSNEKLTPVIRLEDGAVPPNFPETTTALLLSTNHHALNSLLLFYGLPQGKTLYEKTDTLKVFFGINT